MANRSTYRTFDYCDLGLVDYKEAWDLQKKIFELRRGNQIPDTFFMLQHPHTYTLGKVADKSNLLSSEEQLKDARVSVYEIDRGG